MAAWLWFPISWAMWRWRSQRVLYDSESCPLHLVNIISNHGFSYPHGNWEVPYLFRFSSSLSRRRRGKLWRWILHWWRRGNRSPLSPPAAGQSRPWNGRVFRLELFPWRNEEGRQFSRMGFLQPWRTRRRQRYGAGGQRAGSSRSSVSLPLEKR